MKGNLLVVLMIVGYFLWLNSCSNKKKISYQYRYNVIIGDCFKDSISYELDTVMNRLGMELIKYDMKDKPYEIYIDPNRNGYYGLGMGYYDFDKIYYKNILNDKIQKSIWLILIKENKLTLENRLYYSSLDSIVYRTLKTNKQDTSFWNVIDVIKKYCDIRDTLMIDYYFYDY